MNLLFRFKSHVFGENSNIDVKTDGRPDHVPSPQCHIVKPGFAVAPFIGAHFK